MGQPVVHFEFMSREPEKVAAFYQKIFDWKVDPKPEAAYVLVHAEQGFTANVPLADLDREEVLLATHHDGEPLTAEPPAALSPV